ncbi:MAG: hypothetical protein AAGF49_15815, partial [Pseudomonadota bacterium]
MVAIGVGVLLILLLMMKTGRRKRGPAPRDADVSVAAVQAERDVLRANHAVEIAALETKLAKSQERAHGDADATLRQKEAERALARANEEVAALTAKLGGIDTTTDIPALVAERDEARDALETHKRTVSELREELRETVNKLTNSTAERQSQNDRIVALENAREVATSAKADEQETAQALRAEVKALKDRLAEAAAPLPDSDVAATLESERDAAVARETAANEALSRLAYEHDALQGRAEAAERQERDARTEVDKQAA